MSVHHRIKTVYGKELIDILRDRRTLIAMIVVPIVLYPLLMIGSIQAVSFQAKSLGEEVLLIGTLDEQQQQQIAILIDEDARLLERLAEARPVDAVDAEDLPNSLKQSKLAIADTRQNLIAAVQDREIHVGVIFTGDPTRADESMTIEVELLADLEEVRSRAAFYRISEMLERITNSRTNRALESRNLPQTLIRPFQIAATDLAAPQSILGQVLPLILILMTITGAIYPAIDLTAGERERGTLESLMVCPVPVFDLIVGKFMVVTTVAIMGAGLNLASVSATVYFGGFDQLLASTGGGIPIWTICMILLCLIPFAVLMSAIMIAVCSYARTFKEAQNYVTPVILAVLIPGGIAAMPTAKAEGVMLVMPVGNMVLLARDLLLGMNVPFSQFALAVLSTTLYAGAAVAIAAAIFGRESVVFADSGSFNTTFKRRYFKPAVLPPVSSPLLYLSLLFPAWFFIQTALGSSDAENTTVLYRGIGIFMPILFVLVPMVILWFWKINTSATLGFRLPAIKFQVAGVLVGLSAWVPAAELNILQKSLFGLPGEVADQARLMAETLRAMPISHVLLFTAVVPAVCEELLFRGFLLSGLRASAKKWLAIISSGLIFGVFHFFLFKLPVTAALGMVLAYLCWQSRSILPSVMAHFLHNSIATMTVLMPEKFDILTGGTDSTSEHLPIMTIVIGCLMLAVGLAFAFIVPKTEAKHTEAIA
ncbi:MAG: ABC transporter permease subunit/CPBP intramembrane protease [Planctomycetota bacterium]|jgi:ABC-2 type transport system permease protein/sodium transport system permease protein